MITRRKFLHHTGFLTLSTAMAGCTSDASQHLLTATSDRQLFRYVYGNDFRRRDFKNYVGTRLGMSLSSDFHLLLRHLSQEESSDSAVFSACQDIIYSRGGFNLELLSEKNSLSSFYSVFNDVLVETSFRNPNGCTAVAGIPTTDMVTVEANPNLLGRDIRFLNAQPGKIGYVDSSCTSRWNERFDEMVTMPPAMLEITEPLYDEHIDELFYVFPDLKVGCTAIPLAAKTVDLRGPIKPRIFVVNNESLNNGILEYDDLAGLIRAILRGRRFAEVVVSKLHFSDYGGQCGAACRLSGHYKAPVDRHSELRVSELVIAPQP